MTAPQTGEEVAGRAPAAPAAGAGAAGPAAPPADGQAELREDIRRTREQLGQTVQELIARADVKARAKDQARQITARVSGRAAGAGERAATRTAGAMRRMRSWSPAERAELVAAASGVAAAAWMGVVIARRR